MLENIMEFANDYELVLLWLYFISAATLSFMLYGYKCFDIHYKSNHPQNKPGHPVDERIAYLSEYFTNGLGTFIGWIALYFTYKLYSVDFNPAHFGWPHLILPYIAYVGITGQLPFVAKFGFIKKD